MQRQRFSSPAPENRIIAATLALVAAALASAGVPMPTDRKYDSVNLVPFLSRETSGPPHDRLFWRSGQQRAVLEGQAKLVRQGTQPDELYDLTRDVAEATALAGTQATKANRLAATLSAWDKELIPPAFPGLGGRKAAKAAGKAEPNAKPSNGPGH